MTQQALANAVGVHKDTVSAWETGQYQPDAPALRSVAEQVGVTMAYLSLNSPAGAFEAPGPGLASRLYRLASELAEIAREVSASEAVVTEAAKRRAVEAVEAVARAGRKGTAGESA